MRAKLLHEAAERVYAAIFETGEDPVEGLTRFAEEEKLSASGFTAIGEQVEVLALVGDIAVEGAKKKVHAHVVLGRHDGSACGGHLLAAKVRPTLEVILTESPSYLRRVQDPQSGLALIRVDK